MTRRNHGFGVRAVLVEAIGIVGLLLLVFPLTDPPEQPRSAQGPVTQAPVTQAPVTQAPVTQGPVTQGPVTQAPVEGGLASRAAELGQRQGVVEHTDRVITRRVPLLHLPAPPVATGDQFGDHTQVSKSSAVRDSAGPNSAGKERREFVARELEYSRRALGMIVQRHVQQLVEPFRGGDQPTGGN